MIIRCENNSKSAVAVRVQITNPAGEVKAWEVKDLKYKYFDYSVEGSGDVCIFIQYKENNVKSPTFIQKTFAVTGKEKGISILSSINLRDMTILCEEQGYSNRRYCVLDIRKYYPGTLEGKLPDGSENTSEKTTFWNYTLSSIFLEN